MKMSRLNTFLAVSALYLGVSTTGSTAGVNTAPSSSRASQAARQTEFEHPAVKPPRSVEQKRYDQKEKRIERRGQGASRQDGMMRRNLDSGATQADEALPESRRPPQQPTN